MRLAERWVEVAPEGFKVIVHVGSTCVKSSQRLATHAQEIGAFGIGAMAPPFPKIGRIEELVKYCEEIAAGAPNLPFYYYHIPVFNGAYLRLAVRSQDGEPLRTGQNVRVVSLMSPGRAVVVPVPPMNAKESNS